MSFDFQFTHSNMPNRQSRPDGLELYTSPLTKTRSLSIGSLETMSNPSSALSTGTGFGSPLVGVSPEPAYIAPSAASQIVTTDHEAFFQNLFDEGFLSAGNSTVLVTPQSLKLVNQFLDYLLWSFLAASRSTSLKHLRPAVSEVLRSRLAREAINGAEAELEEYLGGSEDEELLMSPIEPGEEFDLEKVWKRARLRCMVYSSLGDLEEDDEDAYADGDYPDGVVGSDQYSRQGNGTVVSPAVAIWLTSILEFVGEQTLLIAGHATVARFSQARIAAIAQQKDEGNRDSTLPFPDRPVVEELDAEKVALNPVLGRMWRQWRKGVRSPGSIRAPSREAHYSRRTSVQSVQSVQSSIAPYEDQREIREERNEKTISSGGDTPTPTPQQPQTEIVQDLAVSKALEHGLSAPPRNPLRRSEDEKILLGVSPLTPILETPTITDPEGRKRLTLTLGSEIAEDGGTFLVPPPDEIPRPTSMINLPARPSHFVFPFAAQDDETEANAKKKRELSPDMRAVKRSRSNSLPLPGAFPFGPEDIDFLRPKSAQENVVAVEEGDNAEADAGDKEHMDIDDDVPDVEGERTPISETIPRFPEPGRMRLDEPPLSPGKTPTVISELTDLDETDLESSASQHVVRISTAQSLTISTPITPEILDVSSQSSRRASREPTPQTPMERSESKETEVAMDHIPEQDMMEEAEEEEDLEDPAEIGVARTSDVFVPPPQSLPTPLASPISPMAPAIVVEMPPKSEDNESRKSTDRRISQFYNPAPVPSAPDFYPEHHTEREIEDYHKSRVPPHQRQSSGSAKARDSPRSSLEHSTRGVGKVDSKRSKLRSSPTATATSPPVATPPTTSSPSPSGGGIQAAVAAAEAISSGSPDSYARRGSPTAIRAIDRRTGQSVELPRTPVQQPGPVVPPPVQPDRAGVRVWTPPATPDIGDYTRKASVSSKGHARPSNGSGSISSQTSHKLKSIMSGTRPQTAEGRASSSRHGSDDDSVRSESQSTTRDDKEKSFDQLINSGATLQYTLTPDNLKKMELTPSSSNVPGVPASASTAQRVGTADLADFLRDTGPDGAVVPKSNVPARSSSLSKSKGPKVVPRDAKAAPDPEATKEISSFLRDTRPGQVPGKVSGPVMPPPPQSIGDSGTKVTNIVRSTEAQASPAKPAGLVNGRAKQPVPAAKESPRTPLSPTGIFPIIQQNGGNDEIEPVRVKPGSSPKTRLVARDASGTGETTSALIDFFRNTTPPKPNEQSPPRIPRTVAPFRTTMDSAKFDPAREALRSPVSQPSSPDTSTVASKTGNSYPSSYASQTELLKRNESAKREDLGKLQLRQPPSVNKGSSSPMPQRKQTRVKDPYAIESDDEYEEEIYGTPKPQPKREEEESLADFLRNVPPPPATPVEEPPKQVQKKTSALSLMSRFGRSPSSSSQNKKRKDSISSVSTAATAGTTGNQNNYRDTVKHQRFGAGNPPSSAHSSSPLPKSIPIRINTPTSAELPTQNFHPAAARDISTPSSARSVPRRMIAEARDARATSESSDGLADFLRYTGPQNASPGTPSAVARDDFRKNKGFLKRTNKTALAN